mgnify:CR=1 FL=1
MTENQQEPEPPPPRDSPSEEDASLHAPRHGTPPEARVRLYKWKGWIWAVPLAALILVSYLAVRQWVITGPTVTVRFASAQGISRETPVRYRGVLVGRVEEVKLRKDADGVDMTLSMHASVEGDMREGTTFWIVRPEITAGSLSQLLAGSHVAMRPGDGEKTHTFEGAYKPPPLEPEGAGKRIVLYADAVQGLRRGTPVVHKGVRAGEVLGVRYHPKAGRVHIEAFVNEPFDALLGSGARFWAGGDARIRPRGGGVGVDLPTVASVLQGRLTFARFGPLREDADDPEHYTVYASEADARRPLRGPSAAFRVRFPGSVEGLGRGAAVDLAGFRVGRVRNATLSIDPEKPAIRTTVTIDLFANTLGLAGDASDAAAIREAVGQLVSRGMRARLASSSLVLGGKKVSLVMTDDTDASLAKARGDAPPEVPAIAGTDLGSLLASAGGFVNRLGELPIAKIGRDLEQITQRVRGLAASPEVDRSLDKLEAALTEIETLSERVSEATRATMTRLEEAAAGVRDAARTIDRITGGTPRKQNDVEALVAELTDTAASIRRLADLLHREPEALLRGRTPE